MAGPTAAHEPRRAPRGLAGAWRACGPTGWSSRSSLVSLFFYLQNPAFAKPENIFLLLRAMASLALIAFAQLLVIITGELDLSVGSVYGLDRRHAGGRSGWAPASRRVRCRSSSRSLIALGVALARGRRERVLHHDRRHPVVHRDPRDAEHRAGPRAAHQQRARTSTPSTACPPPDAGELAAVPLPGLHDAARAGSPSRSSGWRVAFVIFWVIRHRTLFGFRLLAIGGNPDAARVSRACRCVRYKFDRLHAVCLHGRACRGPRLLVRRLGGPEQRRRR